MIQKNAFNHNKGLTDVYYAGSNKQWESVKISKGNDDLKKQKFIIIQNIKTKQCKGFSLALLFLSAFIAVNSVV